MNDLLRTTGLTAGYGRSLVLRGVDLAMEAGESVALVGPNGAGKSTFLKVISGLLAPKSGQVLVSQSRSDHWTSARIVAAGVVHVPEGRQVFPGLSVAENLWLGGYANPGERRQRREQVLEFFPHLRERLNQAADTLSGGEQQMLAVGRGLMAGPKLLMIDEPTLGLAPVIVDALIDALRTIRRQLGVSLLLVEQNMLLAKEVCDHAFVMVGGAIVRRAACATLDHEELMRTYIGQYRSDEEQEQHHTTA